MNNRSRLGRLAAVLVLVLLSASSRTAAQTVRADRVTLNAGPCVITSGSSAPNGTRIGNICDTFIQTTSGAIWTKTSGTGTSSGWIATLAGIGTPGTLAAWNGTGGSLGDSIVSQAGGVATIAGAATITGAATVGGLATLAAATVTGNAAINGTATIATAHVTGNAAIDATATIGTAAITGNATIGGTAAITGASTLSGPVTLGADIGTASYASQVSGWRITAAGAADVRYLYTDELRARLFTAEAESVLAGAMRVTKSYSTVAFPFTCPASGTGNASLWVADASTYGGAAVFQSGDWVVLHVLSRSAFGPFSISDCVGTVTGYSDGAGAGRPGTQFWSFTRGAGANGGAMTGGTVIAVNELVQDFGVSGNGYVELSAVDGANGSNAPYLQTNTWTSAPVGANLIRQCRLGNLNGVFGNGPEYGLACGANPAVPLGGFVRLSNLSFEVRNVPIDLYDGATQVLRLDPAGPSLALGSPLPASYSAGTGVWMGKDAGVYKMRVGNPTGNRMTWDGNTLSIAGEGSGITNINGGNIQAGTISAAQISVVGNPGGAAINPNPGVSDAAFWPAVPGYSAPLVVTITDGMAGTTALRSAPGRGDTVTAQAAYPIDPNKTYRLHFWTRGVAAANGNISLHFVGRDGNGNATGNSGIDVLPGNIPGNTWTEFHMLWTPAMIGAGTRTAQIYLYLNWNGTATATGYAEAQDVRLEEATPTTLITPGAVTTDTIAAKTITAANIAANSITVAEINATGFGENLIGNSTFEGTIAGWSLDPVAPNGGNISLGNLGPRGPGNLQLNPTGGGGMLAEYFAVPVLGGQPYRIAFLAAPYSQVGTGLFLRVYESTYTAPVRYVRAGGGAYQPGDIGANSSTDPGTFPGFNLQGGWTPFEFIYTPPVGVFWVSLAFFNYSCVSGYGNGCQTIGIDGVEMQAQIGAGRIRANSITANQIAASTITGANIAGGTITGGNIAARTIISGNIASGTISANEIGAGTITADRLVARTITSGYIASGTITANELAATSITADKLNVSSLSAISANLGTVTAGTINGVTINGVTINGSTINAGGGNEVVLNGSGITISSGAGANNSLKWSGGGVIYSSGGTMTLRNGDIQIGANNGSMTYFFESNAFQGSAGLGTQSIPWTSFFVIPPTNGGAAGGSSFYPLQLNVNDNQMHRKTNGYDGQCVITAGKSLYIDHGIVIGCV